MGGKSNKTSKVSKRLLLRIKLSLEVRDGREVKKNKSSIKAANRQVKREAQRDC